MMKDKRKWQDSNNPSFDDPNNVTDKSKTVTQNGILSILGKNIGLLSRNKEKHKKYERSDSISKPPNKIRNFLHFKKPGDNKASESKGSKASKKKEDDNNIRQKKTSKAKPVKKSQLNNTECGNPIKSIISNKKLNKSVKDPISSDKVGQGVPDKTLTTKTKSFKQNKAQAPKSSKPAAAVERKVTRSKLRKASSDSELSVTRTSRTSRASSARSSASSSRPQSTLASRCSSRTIINSAASSKANTPLLPKKKSTVVRKNTTKKKKKISSSSPESSDSGHGSSGSSGSPPVVFVNYRSQVSKTNVLVFYKCHFLPSSIMSGFLALIVSRGKFKNKKFQSSLKGICSTHFSKFMLHF